MSPTPRSRRRRRVLAAVAAWSAAPAAAAGCGAHPVAVAALEARSGSAVAGQARFTERHGIVTVRVTVRGAAPGTHGVHVHAAGDCSAPDATSAGEHFDPDGHPHGSPALPPAHAGDLGNLHVGPDGTGSLTRTTTAFTITPGPRSVANRALVVHAGPDDLRSGPEGGAGARIACGVIQFEAP